MALSKCGIYRIIAVLTFFLTIFGFPFGTSAQGNQSSISFRAQAAFNGFFKYGEWLPIYVEVENSGPDLDADVQVRVPAGNGATIYTLQTSLPSLSRKLLVIYVVPNNFSRQLDVKLVTDNQQVAAQIVTVTPLAPVNYLVGLLSAEPGALNLLKSVELADQKRSIELVDLSLSEFPEKYEGLRSFDLMVINNIDTSTMTREQLFSLETWVQRGGRLVIGGGAGAARTVSGLSEILVPLELEGRYQADELPGLEEYINNKEQIKVPGPFLISTGSLNSGLTLATQEDLPLIVEKPLGSGYVDFVTLDLSVSPFNDWSGAIRFWEKLISPGSAYPDWQPLDISMRQQSTGQMPYALSNLPVLDLPSVQSLMLILSVYIILVGPVNYFILRWRKRLHWAWITIPLITLLFSVLAFGLGYMLHGTDIFINKISVIELGPSGRAHINNYVGIFSPGQQNYEIEVPGGGLISPLEVYSDPWSSISPPSGLSSSQDAAIVQGDPAFIRGLAVDQWSLQSFLIEGIQEDVGNIDTDLLLQNDRLTGTLHNRTDRLLQDAKIVFGKQYLSLSDISPGEKKSIDLDLSAMAAPSFGPPISYLLMEQQLNQPESPGASRQAEVKRIIIESVLERGPISGQMITRNPVLIGWLDTAPPEIQITGETPAQQTTALLYTSLPYRLPDSGFISAPPGLVPGNLIQNQFSGGPCGDPGSTSVYLAQGIAQFEFRLPISLWDLEIENLKFSIYTDTGDIGLPEVAFYHWDKEEWITYVAQQGRNLIPNAADHVRQDGLIHLRLSQNENSMQSGCYYLALGLEGWR